MMRIEIQDLKFQAILGILDFERTTEQDLILDLVIEYEFDTNYIDYAAVSQYLESSMKNEKFLLIEDALAYFEENLQKNFPQISRFDLKISKPSIMPNCRVSVASSKEYIS